MWCQKRIGNMKWSDGVTNESLLQKIKTKRQPLYSIQKRKKNCHLKRKVNVFTTVIEGKIEGN